MNHNSRCFAKQTLLATNICLTYGGCEVIVAATDIFIFLKFSIRSHVFYSQLNIFEVPNTSSSL